jgi:hypothetical protein
MPLLDSGRSMFRSCDRRGGRGALHGRSTPTNPFTSRGCNGRTSQNEVVTSVEQFVNLNSWGYPRYGSEQKYHSLVYNLTVLRFKYVNSEKASRVRSVSAKYTRAMIDVPHICTHCRLEL